MKTAFILKNIVFLCLILTIFSCTEPNTSKEEKNSLTATWVWISSTGGIAGVTITPKSSGNAMELKISSDYKYAVYTNGNLTSGGSYKIDTQKCIHDNTMKSTIIFSNDTAMMIEKIDNTNLILSDENYDGFSVSYIRK